MTASRPPRLYIPIAVRRESVRLQGGACTCGCALPAFTKHKGDFDHDPALRLRTVNILGTDYIPPQLDPAHIVWRCKASHKRKTHGSGATTAGTDIGKIKKERKRTRPEKPKRKIAPRPFSKGKQKIPTRKMRTR